MFSSFNKKYFYRFFANPALNNRNHFNQRVMCLISNYNCKTEIS